MKTITLITNAMPLLLKGMVLTLKITSCALCIGLVFGIILGTLNSKKIKTSGISHAIDFYVLLFRGTPVYVQVLLFYFALPDLLGINMSPFFAGTLALGCNSIAYIAEIVRGGINAIPSGQWDACYVLGYSKMQMFAFVILPQAIAQTIPTLMSEFTALLKETAILSSIGIAEMTKVAMNINAKTFKPMPMYLTVACLYLLLTTTATLITKKIEKGVSHDKG